MRSSSKGHYSYHLKLSSVRYGHGVANVSKRQKKCPYYQIRLQHFSAEEWHSSRWPVLDIREYWFLNALANNSESPCRCLAPVNVPFCPSVEAIVFLESRWPLKCKAIVGGVAGAGEDTQFYINLRLLSQYSCKHCIVNILGIVQRVSANN